MAGYGQPAGSTIGALLRQIQEEKQKSPLLNPPGNQEGSPIRNVIQSPLQQPESPTSSRIFSAQPELTPSLGGPQVFGPGVVPPEPAGPLTPDVPVSPAPQARALTPRPNIGTQIRPSNQGSSNRAPNPTPVPTPTQKQTPSGNVANKGISSSQRASIAKAISAFQHFAPLIKASRSGPLIVKNVAPPRPNKPPTPTPTPSQMIANIFRGKKKGRG